MPNRTLRVLYVEAGSGSGGSSASLVRLLDQLAPTRVTPVVLVHQHGTFTQELARRGIAVDALMIRDRRRPSSGRHWREEPSQLWHNLVWLHAPLLRQMVRRIAQFHPDLIHINNSPRVALAAIAAARWCRVPVVCHLRTARALSALERWVVARWVDRLIVLSSASQRACLTQGIAAAKIVLIPDGIDVAAFRNGVTPDAARAALGLSAARPVIGSVSRLIAGKGHEPFVRALRMVVDQRPDVQAVIVGDVCEGASEYPQRLKALVAQLGLQAHVRFIGWTQQTSQVYPAFDVFAQTSLLPEGLPGVCIEAMASHLPVVSTAVGGAVDLVEDGLTGRLVPPNDSEAMATALLELLNDPSRRAQMGNAGYQRALQSFDIHRTAAAIEAVYRSAVEEAR